MLKFLIGVILLTTWTLESMSSQDIPEGVRRKIVLLTSIDYTTASVPFFRKEYFRTYPQFLEKIFRKELSDELTKNNYILDVQHYSKQSDLWRELHSPKNIAVIWLSHSGHLNSGNKLLEDTNVIADLYGYDLAPVLIQGAHSQLQFLGIVGCSADVVINQLKSLERFRGLQFSENTTVYFPPQHTLAATLFQMEGVRDSASALTDTIIALKAKLNFLRTANKETNQEIGKEICVKKLGIPLNITRTILEQDTDRYHPPVRIISKQFNQESVIGVFPSMAAGESQTLRVYLKQFSSNYDAYDLKILFTTGNNSSVGSNDISIGQFEISAPLNEHAKWLSQINEKVIPVITTNIFLYEGPLNESFKTEIYQTGSCLR